MRFDRRARGIDDREVHVWHNRLDVGDESILSADEIRRARRFVFAEDYRRYVAGRSWLRSVLGSYSDRAPSQLSFRYGKFGKPSLDRPGPAFNLAHSGDQAVLVVAASEPVGVDVEVVRPGVFDLNSAKLVLSQSELVRITRSTDRDAAFIRAWVRKEAYGKAFGHGLQSPLANLALEWPVRGEAASRVSFREFELRAGVVVAVVAPIGSRMKIVCGQNPTDVAV